MLGVRSKSFEVQEAAASSEEKQQACELPMLERFWAMGQDFLEHLTKGLLSICHASWASSELDIWSFDGGPRARS